MTGSRGAIAVVAATLVLAACGPGADDEVAEDAPPDGTGERPLVLEAGFDEPLRVGGPVTWRLTVGNDGDATTLTFPTGQSGEVVLVRDGDEAYRWSEGQMFTQAVREESLPAGASTTYELEEPVLDVPPGDYELRASLTSDPAPGPVSRVVAVVD